MNVGEFYKNNYKKLLLIPLFLLIFSIIVVGAKISSTGDFINKDVSLKGGITATVYTQKEISIESIEDFLQKKFIDSEINIRKLTDFNTQKQVGFIIETTKVKELSQQNTELKTALQGLFGISLTSQNYSTEEMSSTLGESFYKEMLMALMFAFLFMGLVVLITFRKLVPSLAVVASAFLDIFVTLAIVNLLGVRISTAGIAAFLLVIGYSIDTDILLTTRLLKRREGDFNERIKGAMKTGLTMTTTTLVALFVAFVMTNSHVLKQMFGIILIALVIDIISTWAMNASLLTWYCKKKNIQ